MNDIEKNDGNNIENFNRDRYIFDLISGRFNLEWERSINLDAKANNFIGFVGIILTLEGGLVSNLFKDISRNTSYYIYFLVIIIISFICLLFSIICSFNAHAIKEWRVVPATTYLIEEYAQKNKSYREILIKISKEFNVAINKNKLINDEKAKYLNNSQLFLEIGISFFLLFIVCLIL